MTHPLSSFRWAFALVAFGLVGLAGCDRDDEASLTQLRVNFNLLWDAEPFTLGQSGLDVQARPVQLERLECFVSAFALHDQDRGWIEIDTIKRVNFIVSEPHAMLDILTEGDLRIDGIRMGLGVPADQNKGVDPASYPSNHPLGARGSAGCTGDGRLGTSSAFTKGECKQTLRSFGYQPEMTHATGKWN